MAIFTPDRRYIVVRGRLWRAANPALSESMRGELTRALMTARRAVHAALKKSDRNAERLARRKVDETKVALGERGPVWWTDGAPDLNRRKIENTNYREWWQEVSNIRSTMLALLTERRQEATICPSEIARATKPHGWRTLMPTIRDVARELAREGLVEIKQKGKPLSPDADWRGPIRIAHPGSGRLPTI